MKTPYNLPDFLGALVSIAVGIVVSLEAYRLQAYSSSLYVGDHTLPAILGLLLLVLGGSLLLQSYRPGNREEAGEKPPPYGKNVACCLLVLFIYGLVIDILGYVLSTWLVSLILFRVIGAYRWRTALFQAVILTGSLYVVFVLWLQIMFPTGFFL